MEQAGNPFAEIERVKNLTAQLFKNVKETEDLIFRGNGDKVAKERKQREAFKSKVNARIKDSLDSVWVTDEASSMAASCLSRLQHDHYSLGAALMVCSRRLELREGRPPQESKEDRLQEALAAEQEILNSAREAMLVLGGELMRRIDELNKVRTEISAETAQVRREANEADKQGNHNALNSAPNSVASTPRASVMRSPQSFRNNEDMKERHQALIVMGKRASELQAEVGDLSQRTDILLTQSKAAADQSAAHVSGTLQRRTGEASALTRTMRSHVTNADFALLVAERTLEKSVRKLDPDDAQALSKFAASKGMVEELRCTKKDLQEDLWRKTVSLNIDEACRRVTPQWAAGCYERPPETARSPASATRRRPMSASVSTGKLKS